MSERHQEEWMKGVLAVAQWYATEPDHRRMDASLVSGLGGPSPGDCRCRRVTAWDTCGGRVTYWGDQMPQSAADVEAAIVEDRLRERRAARQKRTEEARQIMAALSPEERAAIIAEAQHQ